MRGCAIAAGKPWAVDGKALRFESIEVALAWVECAMRRALGQLLAERWPWSALEENR